MSAANEELQQRVASLAETKRGRQEADWKKLENEKRVILQQEWCVCVCVRQWEADLFGKNLLGAPFI